MISSARSHESDCFDQFDVDLTFCEEFQVSNQIIEIDAYPGCEFVVEYNFHRCQSPFATNLTVYIPEYKLVSHNCDEYDDDVTAASNNGTLADFSVRFDGMLVQAIQYQIIKDFPAIFTNLSITFSFATATCANYCYSIGSKADIDFFIFEKVTCGDGCCYIENFWKFQNGEWTYDSSTSFPVTEDCDDSEIFASCQPGTIYSTDCTFTCDMFN